MEKMQKRPPEGGLLILTCAAQKNAQNGFVIVLRLRKLNR
jgi:hypothetical protein